MALATNLSAKETMTRNYRNLTLRLPKEVDPTSLWAFITAMGWTQYVVSEPVPQRKKPVNFFAEFHKLPQDNTPDEVLREQMYKEKYGF